MGKLYLSLYASFRTGIREDISPILNFLVDVLFYFTFYVLIPFLLIYLLGYIRIVLNAHIHEFNKEEDKDVRWVEVLFASLAKGLMPFIGLLFLLFSIPFLQESIVYQEDYVGPVFGIFATIYCIMLVNIVNLISPFIYFHFVAKKGMGIFGPKAIRSFVRRECGECSKKIATISLGNSVMLGDEGLEYKCPLCRNIKLKKMPLNISYGMNSSFDDTRVNPYWVIQKIFKKIKKEKLSAPYKFETKRIWMNLHWFLRDGVFGYLQAGDFEGQWSSNNTIWGSEDFYKNIPLNCPECGYRIGYEYEGESYSNYKKIKECGYCTSCNIKIDDMSQFRDSYENDEEYINKLLG